MKTAAKILLAIFSAIILLFVIRLINPSEIDDVSREIPCSEIETYNPDILYIIPNFNDKPISQNQTFCKYIFSLNKTLELHGINHQPYREFLYQNVTQENLTFAIKEFQNCFNQTPEKFKPPQLKISLENKKLIKQNNLELKNTFSQITHKVYHCNDEGLIRNWIVRLF